MDSEDTGGTIVRIDVIIISEKGCSGWRSALDHYRPIPRWLR